MRSKQRGFTLIEAVVAMAVFAIGIAGLVQLVLIGNRTSDEARQTVEASNHLQEGVEAVRSIRDASWDSVATPGTYRLAAQSGQTPAWQLENGVETIGIFTRTVTLSDVRRNDTNNDGVLSAGDTIAITGGAFDDPATKKVTVQVTWTKGSRTLTRELFTYITRWNS